VPPLQLDELLPAPSFSGAHHSGRFVALISITQPPPDYLARRSRRAYFTPIHRKQREARSTSNYQDFDRQIIVIVPSHSRLALETSNWRDASAFSSYVRDITNTRHGDCWRDGSEFSRRSRHSGFDYRHSWRTRDKQLTRYDDRTLSRSTLPSWRRVNMAIVHRLAIPVETSRAPRAPSAARQV